MPRSTRFPDRPLPRWAVASLVSVLLVTSGAFVVMFARSTANSSLIRSDAEKEVLIADMGLAVQLVVERAGQFAGQALIGQHDSTLEEPGLSVPGGDGVGQGGADVAGTASAPVETSAATDLNDSTLPTGTASSESLLAHHPEVRAAAASFSAAAGSVRQLMSASEIALLDETVAAHTAYTASIIELDARSHGELGAMSFYHEDTQHAEAALRSILGDLQRASRQHLQSAIARARSTEAMFRVALPIIFMTGLLAAIYLLRTRAMKRRVATLEDLISAKDQFLGAVSHELRTPLTAIVGFAALLNQAEGTLTARERAKMIASIVDQSREVAGIVEDLLVAARGEMGELTIISVPVDLRSQAARVLDGIQLSDIEHTGGAAANVVADPGRVRQILRNLLTNAARYGDGNIQVDYGRSIEYGHVQVRNSGMAIADHDRERIFEPYQRAHNNPGLTGSIGIGLTVSRRLARLMGGDLTYQHRAGTNIFELTLPLRSEHKLTESDAAEFATT